MLKKIKAIFSEKGKKPQKHRGMEAITDLAKKRKNKLGYIGGGIIVLGILYQMSVYIYEEWTSSTPEYLSKKDRQTKTMASEEGDAAYFQAVTAEEIKNINTKLGALEKGKKEAEDKLTKQAEENNKALQAAVKKLDGLRADNEKRLKSMETQIQTLQDQNKTMVQDGLNQFKEEIFSMIQESQKSQNLKNQEDLSKKITELEDKLKKIEERKQAGGENQKLTLKNIEGGEEKGGGKSEEQAEQKNQNDGKDALVENQIRKDSDVNVVFETPTYSLYDEEAEESSESTIAHEEKNETLDIQTGVAEGILFTGGEAQIAGFNGQSEENIPVGIRLLTNMTIANDNYTQVEDCLLLGSAKGSLASNRATIRLAKISCIYKKRDGSKVVASGRVHGWVMDENAQLGVKGQLISREGKIIQTAIPLTLLETGLSYLTNSQTNVFLDGNSVASALSSSLSSGFSNGGAESLQKLTEYYLNFLEALSPTISFRAGRKISILFQGGESIQLKPYTNGGVGESFLDGYSDENTKERELLVGGDE